MASQTVKKELLEETLHHHPEGSEEEVDKEWEEFTRLMAKLKENRRNRPHRYIHVECSSLILAKSTEAPKFRGKEIRYLDVKFKIFSKKRIRSNNWMRI